MKVALIGRNEARLGGVPYGDPSWSLWGLAWDPLWRDRCEVLFDPHWPILAEGVDTYARTLERPVYMNPSMLRPEYPSALAYPFAEVQEAVFKPAGRPEPYLESSIAYMFALALSRGATTIGLYGISMNGTGEYAYQRPNMEYLIGLAHGRGVSVIQDMSQRRPGLLISGWKKGIYGHLEQ